MTTKTPVAQQAYPPPAADNQPPDVKLGELHKQFAQVQKQASDLASSNDALSKDLKALDQSGKDAKDAADKYGLAQPKYQADLDAVQKNAAAAKKLVECQLSDNDRHLLKQKFKEYEDQ